MKESDAKLMEKIKKGDNKAFDELFRRYGERILGFFYNRTHDYQLSEDYRQETFFKLCKTSEQYKGRKFFSYLFSIAKNIWLDNLKHEKKHRKVISIESLRETEGEDDHIFYIPSRESDQPDKKLLQKESRGQLISVIMKLPKRQRLVILLNEYVGLSHQETARILNCSQSVVSTSMSRALRRLKKLLESQE